MIDPKLEKLEHVMRVMSIRERAKVEELWCFVKHLLNAEEHGVETIVKLAREMREALDAGKNDVAVTKLDQIQRLALLVDGVRRFRQEAVDLVFIFKSEMKLEELEGEKHAVREKEEKQSSGEEVSGEDPRVEEDLFKEYVPQKV